MAGPWSNVADAYSRSFAGLCGGAAPFLLDALGSPGRLLDVGAGTGLLAREAERRGHVVHACEPEPDLAGLVSGSGVPVVRAGLPHLPFRDGTFDAVTACFVVNHLADPRTGVAELLRVTRSGGRLAATIWPPGPKRQGELFRTVMERSGATQPDFPPLPALLDFERTETGLAALLEECGWREVTTRTIGWTWRPTPDDFWAAAEGGVAGFGVAWKAQTPATRLRMREVFDDVSRDYLDGERLDLPTTAVLGVGRSLR